MPVILVWIQTWLLYLYMPEWTEKKLIKCTRTNTPNEPGVKIFSISDGSSADHSIHVTSRTQDVQKQNSVTRFITFTCQSDGLFLPKNELQCEPDFMPVFKNRIKKLFKLRLSGSLDRDLCWILTLPEVKCLLLNVCLLWLSYWTVYPDYIRLSSLIRTLGVHLCSELRPQWNACSALLFHWKLLCSQLVDMKASDLFDKL